MSNLVTLLFPKSYVYGGLRFAKGKATPVSDVVAKSLETNEHFKVVMSQRPAPLPDTRGQAPEPEVEEEAAGTETTLAPPVKTKLVVSGGKAAVQAPAPDPSKEGAVTA